VRRLAFGSAVATASAASGMPGKVWSYDRRHGDRGPASAPVGVDLIHPVAAREWSGRITTWAWKPVPRPEQRDRTDRQYKRDLELPRPYESALAGQNIWQAFMLATGFFGQVFRVFTGEIGAA
jgi:hypothetical protein